MGFYSRVIFPRLCDYALDRPSVARHRRELLAGTGGDVLEIGFGTGLNLPYYPPHVRRITAIDPNPAMHKKARRRIERTGIEVDRRLIRSEALARTTSASPQWRLLLVGVALLMRNLRVWSSRQTANRVTLSEQLHRLNVFLRHQLGLILDFETAHPKTTSAET